jgi:UDP-glucuronate decarboxylase
MLSSDIDEIINRIGSSVNELSNKHILITGGCGFLGRYFNRVLEALNRDVFEKPCEVTIIDNLITAGEEGNKTPVSDHISFLKHDITLPIKPDKPVDYILHAAGIASPFYYRAFPLETLDVATLGTRNILELAKEFHSRILFFSSSEIYGDPDPRFVPIQESYRGNVTCQGPRACYDESKRLGETLCYVYHEKFGINTGTVRPFNVYGPGMQEKDYRVLPNFASRIKGGLPLNVYGNGDQTRTFCYITDAIVGFFLALVKGVPGGAYNIGNPTPEISMIDLVKTIEKLLGRNIPHKLISYPDSYPGDEPQRRCPDIRKARIQLDYSPKVSLEDGLARFLEWTENRFIGVQ